MNAPPGGFRRRPQLTPEQRAARRDTLNAGRAEVIQALMTRLAGSENKRAEDEFTNIKLMKDTTAAQLLKVMDYYGKSLSVGCTYCHVGGGKWDEDTKDEKNTARVMIELVNSINSTGLSKLPPNRNGQTPRISCMTCHRGNTQPGTAMLP
ncbi:MAG: c-type cytochrome [Gemmatimonadales bacterium]